MAVLLRHLHAIMLCLWSIPPAFCIQVGAGQPSVLRAQLLLKPDADIAGSHASEEMPPEAGDPMASFIVLHRRPDEAYALRRNALAHATNISQLELAVTPAEKHVEGLGSIFQHYRNSLSYALAFGLPWVGKMINDHDRIDYTEMLGLCQPLCRLKEDSHGFKRVRVPKRFVDLEEGVFKPMRPWTDQTVLEVSENRGRGWYGKTPDDTYDKGHTKYLTGVRERYRRVMPSKCPDKPFVVFHYRWGDVETGDFDHPDMRSMSMTTGASILASILRTCDLDVKLMSEGDEVGRAFAQHFPHAFEYIDGSKSHDLSRELNVFACSTVLIGGISSFSVLGALLSSGMVIAPKNSVKYSSLDAVLDARRIEGSYFEEALRKVAPEACARRITSK